MKSRCSWVNLANPDYIRYHDEQWGKPVYDDRLLFEMLVLEGAQAGLSWETILAKREEYTTAFDDFDAQKVAIYGESKIVQLLQNPGIIRNARKIRSAIKNAQVFLDLQREFGSFSAYLWSYTQGQVIYRCEQTSPDIPSSSPLSETISKDLKTRWMSFVGPTIIYAYLQAVGIVQDHEPGCFLYQDVSLLAHPPKTTKI